MGVELIDVNDGTVAQDMANADTNFDTIEGYLDELEAARDGEATLLAQIDAIQALNATVTTEVTNARDGESTLLAQIDALQALIATNIADISLLGSAELPGQSGNSGKQLTTNGSVASWETPKSSADKTSTATLTAEEVNGTQTLTNDGAAGEVVLTWPALVDGQEATFYVNDAQYLQIKAPAATTIRIGAVQSAAAGYVRSNTVGNWITIKAMPDELVVFAYGGTWNYDQ